MPRGAQPVHLPVLLRCAERGCLSKEFAAEIEVSNDHAAALLRYWEVRGMIVGASAVNPDVAGRRGAPNRKRYTLTPLGRERLAEIRGIRRDVYAASTDLAAALGYQLRRSA